MIQLKPVHSSRLQSNLAPRILIFNNAVGGHHPGYLKLLLEDWCDRKRDGHLFLLASPLLLKYHPDIVDPSVAAENNIHLLSIADEEHQEIANRKRSFGKTLKEWEIIGRYIKKLEITHCFLPTIDHFLPILVFDRSTPCSLSGIYLRPTFHYRKFEQHRSSWKENVRGFRQRVLLFLAEKNSKLDTLFCLDPFVVDYIKHPTKLKHLPDPVKPFQPQVETRNLRKELAIAPHKKIFLLFGALNRRKGIYQVLESLKSLSDEQRDRVCLILVGALPEAEQHLIETVLQELSSVQVIKRYDFITEAEVQEYFALCDVVLATYQQHVGMSGILLLAAAMQKPILGSNYGLMGELTRRYELGQAVDSSNPDCIANAIVDFLENPPDRVSNVEKMKLFVDHHHASQFPGLILNTLSRV